jgi:tripartite ATP-independent transporter DctM subunit
MSTELFGLISIVGLIGLVMLRVPVGVAMGMAGLVGYGTMDSWDRALNRLGNTPFELSNGYSLSVVPLFLLMGAVAARSGMSGDLFRAANALFTGRRGTLAMASIGACAGFGAVSGSSLATAATMSRIAIPEMKAHGYHDQLSTGAVASGGTLGILIPPSVILIVYAIIAQSPVEELFAAGLIPGLVLAGLHIVAVWAICRLRPDWAPITPRVAGMERLKEIARMWEMVVLFVISIGGIYIGLFSPTEAAAVGAALALLLGFGTRRLTGRGAIDAVMETVRTSAMLFFIVIMAYFFAYFLVQTRLPQGLVGWVQEMGFGPFTVILLLIAFYLVLGCFLDALGMILITVPIFLPLIIALGFDPIWFGVLVVVVVEVGLITPPVGMNLFVIRAQQPDIPLMTLYRGILPFLGADAVLIALLLAVPGLATWLPSVLF